jgi:hypothetical protein
MRHPSDHRSGGRAAPFGEPVQPRGHCDLKVFIGSIEPSAQGRCSHNGLGYHDNSLVAQVYGRFVPWSYPPGGDSQLLDRATRIVPKHIYRCLGARCLPCWVTTSGSSQYWDIVHSNGQGTPGHPGYSHVGSSPERPLHFYLLRVTMKPSGPALNPRRCRF